MTRHEAVPVVAGWVPSSCTLPTAERPLRAAEFETLFASALVGVDGGGERDWLRLVFDDGPGVLESTSDLMARENDCCSFFTFGVGRADGRVMLDVSVGSRYAEVLRGLERQARAVLDRRGTS